MEQVEVSQKKKGQEPITAILEVPQDVVEAVTVLGESEAYRLFREGYIKEKRSEIFRKKKRILRLDLAALSAEQLAVLKSFDLLKS